MAKHWGYAVLFLLGAGLTEWIGQAAGQRPAGQSPTSSLPIIASSVPRPMASAPQPDRVAPLPSTTDPRPVGLPIIAASTAPGGKPVTETSLPRGSESAVGEETAPALRLARTAPVPATALSVEKSGPTQVMAGKPFVYEIVVRNTGKEPLLRIHVEDATSPGSQVLRAQPRPEMRDGLLVWTIERLEAGREQRFRVEARPGSTGTWESSTTATFSALATLRARVTPPPVVLEQTGPPSARLGDMVSFKIQVRNAGAVPLHNVVLHDKLPAGLEHPQGAAIEAVLGTLAPGETQQVTLDARAVQVGRQVNEATITADEGWQISSQTAILLAEREDRPPDLPLPGPPPLTDQQIHKR